MFLVLWFGLFTLDQGHGCIKIHVRIDISHNGYLLMLTSDCINFVTKMLSEQTHVKNTGAIQVDGWLEKALSDLHVADKLLDSPSNLPCNHL